MLRWTVVFLMIALISGLVGFSGFVASVSSLAKGLFYVFITLFCLSLIMNVQPKKAD